MFHEEGPWASALPFSLWLRDDSVVRTDMCMLSLQWILYCLFFLSVRHMRDQLRRKQKHTDSGNFRRGNIVNVCLEDEDMRYHMTKYTKKILRLSIAIDVILFTEIKKFKNLIAPNFFWDNLQKITEWRTTRKTLVRSVGTNYQYVKVSESHLNTVGFKRWLVTRNVSHKMLHTNHIREKSNIKL